MNIQKCSALTESGCQNGFYSTAVCHGISADKVVPMCCNEELCGRLFDYRGGKPKTLDERRACNPAYDIKEQA